MLIKVNGKNVNLEEEVTLRELLVIQQVEMPDYVTVQVNEEFIERDQFDNIIVKNQDVVEFLYFMGGGRFFN